VFGDGDVIISTVSAAKALEASSNAASEPPFIPDVLQPSPAHLVVQPTPAQQEMQMQQQMQHHEANLVLNPAASLAEVNSYNLISVSPGMQQQVPGVDIFSERLNYSPSIFFKDKLFPSDKAMKNFKKLGRI
jgi:hypothetical protein